MVAGTAAAPSPGQAAAAVTTWHDLFDVWALVFCAFVLVAIVLAGTGLIEVGPIVINATGPLGAR